MFVRLLQSYSSPPGFRVRGLPFGLGAMVGFAFEMRSVRSTRNCPGHGQNVEGSWTKVWLLLQVWGQSRIGHPRGQEEHEDLEDHEDHEGQEFPEEEHEGHEDHEAFSQVAVRA